MPSSRPDTIPIVIHLLRQLRPASILDVGVGFGKWGHLFREYTDINEAEADPKRYRREHWHIRIDGIEGHTPYLTEMHRYLYNRLWTGDALSLLPTVPAYDLIFLGDIIEHFDKDQGQRLLRLATEKSNKAVIVSTPKFETDQPDLCGNELERHRSLWTARDFKKFPNATVKTLAGDTLLALILRPGHPPLSFSPRHRSKPQAQSRLRLQQSRNILTRLIPLDTPFVLIDEEQIRSFLPHAHVLPFLERNGVYWGPPANDDEAVAELRRLHSLGVRHVAVVESCFWWLNHFKGLANHLRSQGNPLHEDDRLVIFNLNPRSPAAG